MIGPSALKHLCLADLTYTDVGATRGPLPKGYHHLDRRRVVGRGGEAVSKPAMWWSRLGGPLNRGIQEFVTRRYLHSLND